MKKHFGFGLICVLTLAITLAGCGGGGSHGGNNAVYNSFAYVANNNSVSIYSIATNGALTLNGTYSETGAYPRWVVANSAKKCLYIIYTNKVQACSIDANTGALTKIGTDLTFTGIGSVNQAEIGGQYLYFLSDDGSTGAISRLPINGDGSLGTITTTSTGGEFPRIINAKSDRSLLYIGYYNGKLDANTVNANGTLSLQTSVNVSNLRGVAVKPDNNYVYALPYDNSIVPFSNSPSLLTAKTRLTTAGIRSYKGAVIGSFLYTADADDPKLHCFQINNSNGDLTIVTSGWPLPTSGTPLDIIANSNSGSVYVITDTSYITAYGVNNTTGALQTLSSSETGSNPKNIAIARVQQ